MPIKDPIEFGSGSLYFTGMDEAVPVDGGKVESADDVWEDDLKLCTISTEPVEFECKAEFNRDWALVKCCRCGSNMPVTEFWALLYGTDQWICPECKFRETVEEVLRRSK